MHSFVAANLLFSLLQPIFRHSVVKLSQLEKGMALSGRVSPTPFHLALFYIHNRWPYICVFFNYEFYLNAGFNKHSTPRNLTVCR